MRNSKWSLLLVLGLMLTLFLAACSGGSDSDTGSEGDSGENSGETEGDASGDEASGAENDDETLRISEPAEIPSMDSSVAQTSTGIQFTSATQEGLFRLKTGGEIVDGVAKKDETEVSEDGKTYTFHLRDDAKWANGDSVTAEDFVFAWRRALKPETNSVYGPYLMDGNIKGASEILEKIDNEEEVTEEDYANLGVEAVDETTLKVTLAKPVPYFESFAAFPTFYPLNKKFVEEQGDKYALEADTHLSNGPYKLDSWEHEASWKLVKNDQYWDKDAVDVENIDVRVVKERATNVNLYNTDKLDRIPLGGDFIDKYKTDANYKELTEAVLFYLKFNQQSSEKGKFMQNENFRKAIAMAFSKEDYVDVTVGNSSYAADYFIPKEFVQHPENDKDFREINGDELLPYDLEKAQEHWAKAKEDLGFDTIELSFLSSDTEAAKLTSEFFKNQLEKNLEGLTINLKNVPFKERVRIENASEYELSFSGWGPDYKDAISFLDLWVTGGANNDMGYSNEEYDKLIKSARGDLATKPVERFEAMLEAEKVLLDDAAIAPVYQRKRSVLSQPYIKNMDQLNPFGNDYSYKYVEIEK